MPSRAAERIFQRMQQTKSGWDFGDFETLYTGYGFQKDEGGNHTRFSHRKYSDLNATVSRHRNLPPGYAQTAVRNIRDLLAREAAAAAEEEAKKEKGDA